MSVSDADGRGIPTQVGTMAEVDRIANGPRTKVTVGMSLGANERPGVQPNLKSV
jgi:hypothetical protein